MERTRTPGLEALLAEYLLVRSAIDVWTDADREALEAELRGVLFERELDSRELDIVLAATDGGTVDLDALIVARVERALRISIGAAFDLCGGRPPAAPAVIVQRYLGVLESGEPPGAVPSPRGAEPGTERTEILGTLPATEAEAPSTRPLLVLDATSGQELETASGPPAGDDAATIALDAGAGRVPAEYFVTGPIDSRVQCLSAGAALQPLLGVLRQAVGMPELSSTIDHSGRVLNGKYELKKCIGRGGFSTVYLARDKHLDTPVAIKVLNADAARSSSGLDAFKSEARRVTRLSHPNIVDWKVFDELEDGTCFFVMELLEGEELEDLLQREGPLEPARAGRMLLQILDALRTAHDLGDGEQILHLDLKPKNVLVLRGRPGQPERVKVIDFGIGQYVGGKQASDPEAGTDGECTLRGSLDPAADSSSDEHTALAGGCTPEYASPEQCTHFLEGEWSIPLDGRSDLYSLGVMGFRMLTGRQPFETPARRWDYLHAHLHAAPLRVGAQGRPVPRRLAAFIDRCLTKDRDQRFRDTEEAWRQLDRAVHPPRIGLTLAGIGGTLLLAGIAGGLLWPEPSAPAAELYALAAGIESELPEGTLFLGPERVTASLRPGGLVETGPTQVDWVTSKQATAEPLTDWTVQWSADGSLTVEVDGETVQSREHAYVRFTGETAVQYSNPIRLEYVAPGAWRIERHGLEGLGRLDERGLDPHGRRLVLETAGLIEAIDRAQLKVGGRSYAAVEQAPVRAGNTRRFAIDLDEVDWAPGAQQLVLTVFDLADGSQSRVFDATVVTSALEIESAALEAPRFGDVFQVMRGARPRLLVRANRSADFSWSLHDSNGALIEAGEHEAGVDLAIALPDLSTVAEGNSYSGFVEVVADDSRWVSHAEGSNRGRAIERLDFAYHAQAPGVVLHVERGDGSDDLGLLEGEVYYRAQPSMTLRVTRENLVPTRTEVVLREAGDGDAELFRETVVLGDPVQRTASLQLSFGGEGTYLLRTRTTRAGEAFSEHDAGSSYEFVIDSTPPSIESCEPRELVFRAGAAAPELELLAADTVLCSGPPLAVEWILDPDSEAPRAVLGDDLLPAKQRTRLALPAGMHALADGVHPLQLAIQDAAGNASSPVDVSLHVAREGPRLELDRPLARVEWSRSDSGLFEVELQAFDPNGTQRVACEVRRVDTEAASLRLDLERIEPEVDGLSRWRGGVVPPQEWSETSVELELTAIDLHGAERGLRLVRELGEVRAFHPERVEVVGRPAAAMRLVRGNARQPYVFGGRADEVENDLFLRHGLEAYNRHATPRSWEVAYAAGSIEDYYLDETEVTNAQFIAFLRVEQGGPISEDRRTEVLERLASLPGNLPVARIDWEEASAYARWTGKRLPSLVEWEYALRGGSAYRPHGMSSGSAADGELGGEDLATRAEQPHAVDQGLDVTPETRLRGLSGNVSEWTSTPRSFTGERQLAADMSALMREWRVEVLAPSRFEGWDRAERYWVAGGSYQSGRCDFSVVDARRRDWRGPTVGFRCAVSASDVVGALTETGGVQFREVKP